MAGRREVMRGSREIKLQKQKEGVRDAVEADREPGSRAERSLETVVGTTQPMPSSWSRPKIEFPPPHGTWHQG